MVYETTWEKAPGGSPDGGATATDTTARHTPGFAAVQFAGDSAQSSRSGSGMKVTSGIRKAARPRAVRQAPSGRSSSRMGG